ncbi:acylneuraminate cytidylyltransferase family protein [Thauera phenolivorans]|uniref:acylneuraminate cytidylyltransferase family protein n=1 Tax=Thauera phenolivorans TaxID=1792543 RepID=UPI0009F57D7D
MKILALIPARGGSKRLPGKNIKPLNGLPLIAWTIRSAQQSGVCAAIQVSTDDPRIAEVATQYGAEVPGLRPAELSTDTATSVDVALHALDCYEQKEGPIDGLMLLQPTSPFRRVETIREGVRLYERYNAGRPVVSFSPALTHPNWCFKRAADGMEPFLGWADLSARSQDLSTAWTLNGTLYLICPNDLRTARTFVTPNLSPLLLHDYREGVDIDTPEDWALAERLAKD